MTNTREDAVNVSAVGASTTTHVVCRTLVAIYINTISNCTTGTCLLTEPADNYCTVPGRASNRSAINNDLGEQSTRLKLGERAFSVAGPRVWTQLPTDLKTITDTRVFRPKLKSF